jgi:NADH:ubiquinone oxidoreductase subunit 6 (subunit J)
MSILTFLIYILFAGLTFSGAVRLISEKNPFCTGFGVILLIMGCLSVAGSILSL